MGSDGMRAPATPAVRGVRLLAAAAAALAVAAVGAVTVRAGQPEPMVPAVGAGVFLALGVIAARRDWGRGVATTAVLTAVVLGLTAARLWLTVEALSLDLWLLTGGAIAAALGYALRERRLIGLAVTQWAVLVGRPLADGDTFRHCLIATELAVPLPRLDPLLVLGGGALVLGLVHRVSRAGADAGRGWEIAGALLLGAGLLAKTAELPGLPELCGGGDALDDGWAGVALGFGLAAGAWGVATRDAAWAAIGLAVAALTGLMAATLGGSGWWAVAAFVPVATTLVVVERRGAPWSPGPGYGVAVPTWGRRRG